MIPARKPDNEAERLLALQRYFVLDTEPEPEFDRVTALAARILDTPMALVTLVDDTRQWFKSAHGIERGQTTRDEAFCAHTILDTKSLVVPDATLDRRFVHNPLVTGAPHVRFYAGSPLQTPDGYNLGALCAVDTRPRELTPAQLASLEDLSTIVSALLEARLAARARRLFEKVAELSPDVIYVYDLVRHQPVYGNRLLSEVLGHPADQIGPNELIQIMHPDDRQHVLDHVVELATMRDGEQTSQVFRVRDAAGTYHWVRASETVFARGEGGQPTQILGVAGDISALKEAQLKLTELATTDDLTKLPNARALRERLQQLTHEGGRGRRFAVVIADIDHFKKVNDTHGHKVGDAVLAAVARVMKEHIRVTDFAARYGGEEFVIIFTDVDEERGCELAEKLRAAVARMQEPLSVTCSFGVCANDHSLAANDGEALMRAADLALYRAKREGRNRVVRYHELTIPPPP
jgi:diguanylate cyclase (GGDEF)-like protein/PAS domain S-box-containing protein